MTEISVYTIDNDVPVPEDNTARGGGPQVPLRKLEVGESILFPLSKRASVASLSTRLMKEGKRFTIKKIDAESARVWRVE